MLGSNIGDTVWPKCGEIDIMEHVNNENLVNGTIHWDYNGYSYYGGKSANLDVTQYHVYSVEWNSDSVKWFLDGNQYWEANIKDSINGTDEFHKEFFILLNLAIGGKWPQDPDSTTAFPAKMLVDYVRVYQKGATGATITDGTSSGSATGSTTTTTANKTWYLFNQQVAGVNTTSQNMQTALGGITGWQPTKVIDTAPSVWTTNVINDTYPAGTWKFNLWSNNPGAVSDIAVDIYKVNQDGSGAVLLGSQEVRDCGNDLLQYK